eukprot:CAMPEP_0181120202 /NCGR_PEP_ID=MMETSP1071-20121207/24026_1 /TAXON_ID=35127 /ORGANISM="Thalassiosira sp., Strain NH16" /LENGTH=85 /DNA_ID=CAMNT_0023204833 /DNA_START=202 /DNA_END=459 /DNA_ORIENTATION=-
MIFSPPGAAIIIEDGDRCVAIAGVHDQVVVVVVVFTGSTSGIEGFAVCRPGPPTRGMAAGRAVTGNAGNLANDAPGGGGGGGIDH